jgi:hypothetical protein
MRIPVFRSQATATNEAPGASIRARMDPNVMAQAELQKGRVAGALFEQVGEYALMRAKADAEVQYSEAMLAADEEMRLLAEDVGKNGRLEDVTNENGSWRTRSKDIRDRLADNLSSRSMTDAFNARFNQQELTLRFQLRDSIQARIERQIAEARALRMQGAEDAIANGTDITALNLTLSGIGADTARLANDGLGNYEALTKQEYALLKNGTQRAAIKYVDEQDFSIAAASQLHEALKTDDPSGISDPRGLYVYSLMQRLDPEDRVSILKDVNGLSAYVSGPTLEQEQFQLRAQGAAKEADRSISSALNTIKGGGTVSDEDWGQIGQIISSAKEAGVDPGLIAATEAQYQDVSFLRDLATEVKIANPIQVQNTLSELEGGATFGAEGIDTNREQLAVDFLRSFKASMQKAITEDGGLTWGNQNGQIKLAPIDTSFSQPMPDVAKKRIQDAILVRDIYRPTAAGLPAAAPVFLTQAERDQTAANFEAAAPLQKLQMISNINQDYGYYAPSVIAEIAPKVPAMGHVAGLLSDGQGATAEKVVTGLTLLAAGNKPDGATPQMTEPFVREIVSSSLSFLPANVNAQLTTALNESAMAYYTGEASRRGVIDFDPALWQESVLAVTGYDKATGRGGIQEVRGIQTMLPPTMTADDAENLLPKLAPKGLLTVPWNKDLLIDTDTSEMLAEASDDDEYKTMVFGRDEQGRQVYALTYGQYGDNSFAVMTDARGDTITFTFEDLMELE